MKITKPEFELFEYVILSGSGKTFKVTSRRYYPEQNAWEYELNGSGKYFWSEKLEPCQN